MPDIETAGTVAVPIWLTWVGAAALAVSLLLAIKRAGGVALISSLFRVGLIAVGVLAVWLYVEQRGGSTAGSNPGSERRSLDDRKVALMASAIATGSALSCLDEIAGEAVETRCEKAVFASPEAVAADINYVMSQLALLNDGTKYAERWDASYAAELAPLRTALELDRFGIVAHVLGNQGCTPETCDALMRFHDPSKVLTNLRDHTFEEEVKKYTAIWDHRPDGVAATVSPSVALPSTAAPGLSQKYDFPPSSPPVSIMAIEGPSPRKATAPESNDAMPQPLPPRPVLEASQATPPPAELESTVQSAPVTPMPPRRPPQVRAPRPLPAAPPQLPPIELRGTPPPPPEPIRP